MVRVATDQKIAGLRHLADRRIPEKDMDICGIEPEIRRPPMAEADSDPPAGSTSISLCT